MLELDSYQDLLNDIHEKNADIIAVCPEKISYIEKVYEKKAYDFKIYSDKDNAFSKALGTCFQLDANLSGLYQKFGIDLEGTQGNTDDVLPIPITLIVDECGVVKMIHFDTDYTKRFEPKDVLQYL